ncbi:MAG: class I SAM-dependent methyltransferase [Verrucomicrobia bacterium]|nr:class I SAM-dependent methyltransferase [Verrucomicrobiota bacterium]
MIKPFWDDENAKFVVENLFQNAEACTSLEEIRRKALEAVSLDGLHIELGVASGRSLTYLANLKPDQSWFGFDSFDGLPEDWNCGPYTVEKGFFKQSKLPQMSPNVTLFPGLFSQTLHPFLKKHQEPIAFLHVDSDLYTSAKEALTAFSTRLIPGSVILFDEFYNYPTCAEHELKAWLEFLQESGKSAQAIAFHSLHEQAAWLIK